MTLKKLVALLILICPSIVFGQLVVTVAKPKFVGSKTDIKLEMENKFPEKIESARAVLFVLDRQGKMLGQGTQWIVDGTDDRPSLSAGEKRNFHFVLSTEGFGTTNVTTKLTFNRVVLEGGKVADPRKEVIIQSKK